MLVRMLFSVCLFVAFLKPVEGVLLPVEAFASLPKISNVILSPNGKYVASLVNINNDRIQGSAIKLLDLTTKENRYLLLTDNKNYVIDEIVWANNQILLVHTSYPDRKGNTPLVRTNLLRLDINTRQTSHVITKKLLKHLRYIPNILSTVVDYLPDDEDHILMSIAGFKNSGEHTLIKVALTDNPNFDIVQKLKRGVFSWLTDSEHNIRIAIHRQKTRYKIKEKLPNKDSYRDLWQFDIFSEQEVWPLGFGKDPNILYVKALHQGKDAVFSVDLSKKPLTKTLIYANDDYDVQGILQYSNLSGELIAVDHHFITKQYQKLQQGIDLVFPDTVNTIIDFSTDEQKYVVLTHSDIEPGSYYIGDRSKNTIEFLAHKYPDLTPKLLSEKQKITYKARDGLTIEGFLTLPNQQQQTHLPTIIFPHGGPISFDNDSFDYWTQFFANRGYAVLQMNFRGSYGYGFDFMKQGLASWGLSMQDDIEDGTRWMIKQGYTDPNNICIVGASYGGYAALMATIKTPELYQCVISFAGVTDIENLVVSSKKFTNYDIVKKQIGNDFSELWQRSPLKHADKLYKPTLLIHGSEDRVVSVRQSERLYSKLKGLDRNVDFISLEEGDHYLSNNQHRVLTFKAMDKFLKTYLKQNSSQPTKSAP